MDTSQRFWKNCANSRVGPEALYSLQKDILLNFILPCLPEGGKTIDLACSDGEYTSLLSSVSSTTAGYDISEKLINAAKNNYEDEKTIFEVIDLTSETIHGKYDSISCMGLFTCITDDNVFHSIIEKVNDASEKDCRLILKDSFTIGEDSIHTNNGHYEAIYRNEESYLQNFTKYGFYVTQKHLLHINKDKGIYSALFLLNRPAVIQKASQPNKKNIAIIHQYKESWLNIENIYKQLNALQDFNVFVIITPFFHKKYKWNYNESKKHLDSLGIINYRWDKLDLTQEFFDVTIFLSPYDNTRPLNYRTKEINKRSKITVYIPYGLECGGGEKNKKFQYMQPALEFIDVIYTRSDFVKSEFLKNSPYSSEVVSIGHPRLDYSYANNSHANKTKTFTLLWTPHFSFTENAWSSFDIYFDYFIELQKQSSDIRIIFRPHPMLFKELNSIGLDDTFINNLLVEMESLGFIIDREIDHRFSFNDSDVLISDPGSFLIEYLSTQKPVIYLENPFGFGLNEEIKNHKHAFYTAVCQTEISKTIYNLKNNIDPKIGLRAQAVDNIFKNIGNASTLIKDDIVSRVYNND